jgi:hypothetical protein
VNVNGAGQDPEMSLESFKAVFQNKKRSHGGYFDSHAVNVISYDESYFHINVSRVPNMCLKLVGGFGGMFTVSAESKGDLLCWHIVGEIFRQCDLELRGLVFNGHGSKRRWNKEVVNGLQAMDGVVRSLTFETYKFQGRQVPSDLLRLVVGENSLRSLTSLSISFTNISQIPSQLWQQDPEKLARLYFHDNKITELSRSLLTLTSLLILDVSHNPIKNAPTFMLDHPTLLRLDISHWSFITCEFSIVDGLRRAGNDKEKKWQMMKSHFEFLNWHGQVTHECRVQLPFPIFEEIEPHLIDDFARLREKQ